MSPSMSRGRVFWGWCCIVTFFLHIRRFLGVWFVFDLCRTVGVRSDWRVVKSVWWIGGGRRCGVSFHGFRFFLFTDTPFCRFILLLYSERLLVVNSPRWKLSLFFLLRRDLPLNDSFKYDTLEICLAAEKVSGTETILGAQEIRGLWRVYPITRTAREPHS